MFRYGKDISILFLEMHFLCGRQSLLHFQESPPQEQRLLLTFQVQHRHTFTLFSLVTRFCTNKMLSRFLIFYHCKAQ